jgi:zinc transport system permease protein
VLATLLGVLAVAGGLYGSLKFDTPSGPSIVVAALLLFLVSLLSLRGKGNRAVAGRPG